MKNKKGVTLVELMVVVAIIPVLAGIAIPMYNADVERRSLQEAVDTLGAIRDEVCNYTSNVGALPLAPLNEARILSTFGVACPQSTGPAGGRKWIYWTVVSAGNYYCVATAGAAGDIGTVLAGNYVWVEGVWDAANRVFADWRWGATTTRMRQWLPE